MLYRLEIYSRDRAHIKMRNKERKRKKNNERTNGTRGYHIQCSGQSTQCSSSNTRINGGDPKTIVLGSKDVLMKKLLDLLSMSIDRQSIIQQSTICKSYNKRRSETSISISWEISKHMITGKFKQSLRSCIN